MADWERIDVRGRSVYLAVNNSGSLDAEQRKSLTRLQGLLKSRGGLVKTILFPAQNTASRTGLDDYLASGDQIDALFAKAVELEASDGESQYEMDENGTYEIVPTKDGETRRTLSNFTAVIIREIEVDNGDEINREFEIKGTIRGAGKTFTVPANEFMKMDWVLPNLGAQAIMTAGPTVRDRLRAAIQTLSTEVVVEQAYSHTGWTKINGRYHYVHSGGVVGADIRAEPTRKSSDQPDSNSLPPGGLSADGQSGLILAHSTQASESSVRLPVMLQNFKLPTPPRGAELINAVLNSLTFLNLGPDRITLPVYAAIFRAALGPTDFSLLLTGRTGSGKTSLAAIAQQHYGSGLGVNGLPGSWTSTPNFLASLMWYVKDALCVIDDFIPRGSKSDIERAYRDADRVLRGQGNGSGRGRCNPDGSPREPKRPRGLILSTGEIVPTGASLIARCLVIEVKDGDLRKENPPSIYPRLKHLADQGILAKAMAGHLSWLAPTLEKQRHDLQTQVAKSTDVFATPGLHPRSPKIAAELLCGLEPYLEFALFIGALDEDGFRRLWERAHKALHLLLQEQQIHQFEEDPLQRFLQLLAAVLLSERAHVACYDGTHPTDAPSAWGWQGQTSYLPKVNPVPTVGVCREQPKEERDPRPLEVEDDERSAYEEKTRMIPKGKRIGWLYAGSLYLEPSASLAAVFGLAGELGTSLPFTERTLGKALHEAGYLVTRDVRRGYTVRATIQGQRSSFYQVHPSSVFGGPWSDSALSPEDVRRATKLLEVDE